MPKVCLSRQHFLPRQPQTLAITGVVRKLLKLSFLGESLDADPVIIADVETRNLTSDVGYSEHILPH